MTRRSVLTTKTLATGLLAALIAFCLNDIAAHAAASWGSRDARCLFCDERTACGFLTSAPSALPVAILANIDAVRASTTVASPLTGGPPAAVPDRQALPVAPRSPPFA